MALKNKDNWTPTLLESTHCQPTKNQNQSNALTTSRRIFSSRKRRWIILLLAFALCIPSKESAGLPQDSRDIQVLLLDSFSVEAKLLTRTIEKCSQKCEKS